MDMQAALRDRLVDSVAVGAICSDRIYWIDRPQLDSLPAITLQVVTDSRPQHLKGFDTYQRTTIQIDCWGETYAVCRQMTEAVIAEVVPEHTGNGIEFMRAIDIFSTDLPESASDKLIHRIMTQLTVMWSAA